jgi:hypothetical protein
MALYCLSPWPLLDSARGHFPVAVSLYDCGVITLAMASGLRFKGTTVGTTPDEEEKDDTERNAP